MDPNTALEIARQAYGQVEGHMRSRTKDPIGLHFWSMEATLRFHDLDTWISQGGFLPSDWTATQRSDAYQGYFNRETWALHLWLSNDEGLYDLAREIAGGTDDLMEAAENLRTWVEDVLVEELEQTPTGRSMLREVGSMFRVHWYEVVGALRDE